MWFNNLEIILKIDWNSAIDCKCLAMLCIEGFSSEIDKSWNKFFLFVIDYRKAMDWNEDFLASAMDSYTVIVISIYKIKSKVNSSYL